MNPLVITIDGDDDPLEINPLSSAQGIEVDDRVMCSLQGGELIVTGVVDGKDWVGELSSGVDAAQASADGAQADATAAQESADAAASAAADAQAAAETAALNANAAAAASAKRITRSASTPGSTAGYAEGDQWWVYDSSGKVIAIYMIASGLWAKQEIDASSVLKAGSVITNNLSVDALDGMTITGATIQTAKPATSTARVVMNSTGLHGYDSSGTEKTKIGTDGKLTVTDGTFTGTITGSSFTSVAGSGVNLGTTSVNGDGVTTSVGATVLAGAGSVQSLVKSAVGNNSTSIGNLNYPELYLRQTSTSGGLWKTWYGNGYVETFGTDFSINPSSGYNINFNALGYFSSNIWAKPSTASSAANAVWSTADSNGYRRLNYNSSRRALKANIADLGVDPEMALQLTPRRWFDKAEMADVGLDPETASVDECLAAGLQWIPGFVAEEVEAADPLFATYDRQSNEDGTVTHLLQGVAYDRISAALLVLAKDQQARIEALESSIADLASRLDKIA